MKSPITAAQAKSQRFFETVNLLGKMADELRAKVDALTEERDALTERVKALEPATGERVKVGDSRFESWYGETKIQQMGTKQRYREAYEAGLNEAQQVAVPVPLTDGEIDAVTISQWGEMHGQPLAAHRAFARAIEARLGITQQGDAPCNVYWSYSLGGLK